MNSIGKDIGKQLVHGRTCGRRLPPKRKKKRNWSYSSRSSKLVS
jgi:hypothetical protein